jgi:hypothetical protein
MTASSMKPRCLLLDANVVIESHKLGVWTRLKTDYQLFLPATVSRQEVLFYFSKSIRTTIRIRDQIATGEIMELEATADEITALCDVFAPWFLDTLDPGEIEALALLLANKATGASFCTSDAPAIRALAMLHMSDSGISLEMALSKVGLTKKLDVQFTEGFFKNNIGIGQENFITRRGLAEL